MQRHKSISMLILAVVILTAQVAAQKSSGAAAALEAAKQKAIVTGDLNAAIKQYRALADRYAKTDRSVAAMALVLMAQAYETQGSAEAKRIYGRVLKEYPNEKEAVTLARTRLGDSDPSKGPVSRTLWSSAGANPLYWGRMSPDGRFFSHDIRNDLFLHEIATGIDRNLTNYAKDSSDNADESVISPDGKRVAYYWERAQNAEVRIGVASLVGDPSPRSLYYDPGVPDLTLQDWSPDGKWLAVQLYRDDAVQFALIALADGSVRVVKSDPGGGRARGMYFSPDGKYLGYDRRQNPDERHIRILAVDGSSDVTAVQGVGDNQMVGWSPDGRWLLYRSDRTGTVDLWALGVANGQVQGTPQRLKSNLGVNFHALGWGPNGALYYWNASITRATSSVQVAAVDLPNGKLETTPVPTTRGHQENTKGAAWSPDGTRLAYLSGLRDRDSGGYDELIVRSVATSTTREIPLRPLRLIVDLATWTPDGRAVILVAADLKNQSGLYRVDVETGDVSRVLLTPSRQVTDIAWMAGGRSFLAVVGPSLGQQATLYQVDAQTGTKSTIVSGSGGGRPSPDGRTVYYRRAPTSQDGEPAFIARDLASGSERELIRARGLQPLHLSPDGQYIAAAGIDVASNSRVVQLIPTAGGQPRELMRVASGVKPEDLARMNLGQTLSVVSWNLDSRSVLVRKYLRDAAQDELFVLSLDGQQSQTIQIPRTLPQNVALGPDNRQMAYTVSETALPAVREVSVLESFLPKAYSGK